MYIYSRAEKVPKHADRPLNQTYFASLRLTFNLNQTYFASLRLTFSLKPNFEVNEYFEGQNFIQTLIMEK